MLGIVDNHVLYCFCLFCLVLAVQLFVSDVNVVQKSQTAQQSQQHLMIYVYVLFFTLLFDDFCRIISDNYINKFRYLKVIILTQILRV